jgi:hypothetical protein
MYRKFDVTGNLLFAQYFFFKEVNTALAAAIHCPDQDQHSTAVVPVRVQTARRLPVPFPTLTLGKLPVTQYPNLKYPNPYPNYPYPIYPITISDSDSRYPKLVWVNRVAPRGTRIS